MSLVEHATRELVLAGLMDQDSDYNGMIGQAALEIIEIFAQQGHSGFSASMTTDVVTRLMKYEPLTPLTSNPEEWIDRTDISGTPMWQSKRNPAVFSTDGGQTWYHLSDELEQDDVSS